MPRLTVAALSLYLTFGAGAVAPPTAAGQHTAVALTVRAGVHLRVALDRRIRLTGVGQPIEGRLLDPLYAYDRSVVPAGTRVLGHVSALEPVPRATRVRAVLGGDFTPLRSARLRFETMVLADGTRLPIDSRVTSSADGVESRVAGDTTASRRARVKDAIARRVEGVVAPIAQPGRMARLRDALVERLPYHPQYLRQGTVFTLELLAPVEFGEAQATAMAPAGTPLPRDGLLAARLVTPVDSRNSSRGTRIQAVLSEPVFAADRRLVLPEGTLLEGQVTMVKRARWWRRNGQLRFLFETMRLPEQPSTALLASLHAADVGGGDVRIDDEGGTRIVSPKSRFIAPAFAIYAAHASIGLDPIDVGEVGNLTPIPEANVGGRALGGFMGLGAVGIAAAQVSRPVAGVFGFTGLAESVYFSLVARGREMVFPAGTPMQLQLSPGPGRP